MPYTYTLELDNAPVGRLAGLILNGQMLPATTRPPWEAAPSETTQGDLPVAALALACGVGMGRAFYKWVKASLAGGPQPRRATVVVADDRRVVTSRLELNAATIRDIRFPPLDATASHSALLLVTLAPSPTRWVRSMSSSSTGLRDAISPSGRQWLTSKFRLSIPGQEEVGQHVTHVEPFDVRVGLDETALTVTVAAAGISGLSDWQAALGHTPGLRKTATLEYLAPDMTTRYFHVGLRDVSILNLRLRPNGQAVVSLDCLVAEFGFSDATAQG